MGSGSIGQRHLSNGMELFHGIEVTVVSRSKKSIGSFVNLNIKENIASCFTSNEIYDAAIIATPTALHIDNCIEVMNYGVKKIFVEKPVSHNWDGIEDLSALAKKLEVQLFVGYDLRFDKGLNKVKELLEKKIIGTTISAQAEVGQYLPDWREGTDHREGMSAKIALGGGVMLDLIHEFDYLSWLLGPYKRIYGLNKNVDSLEIETEAVSVNIFETVGGVLGTLSLDYLQKDLNRNAKFIGDSGVIKWDYTKCEVQWKTNQETIWNLFCYKEVSRNDRFKDIIFNFLMATKATFDCRLTTLEEALISLKAVIDSKNTKHNTT